MRRRALVCVGAAALVAGWVSAPTAVARTQSLGRIAGGQTMFWTGPIVASERVDDPSLCGTEGECFDYTVHVASTHAHVLRAALRTADESNNWELVLINPSGQQVASGTTNSSGGLGENFDVEVWAHNPAPGAWTIEVVPANVKNGGFNMRGALDPKAAWPASNPEVQVTRSTRDVRRCTTTRRRGRAVRRCQQAHVAVARSVRRQGVYDLPPDLAADAPWGLTFHQPLPMVAAESGNVAALAGAHNADATVLGQPIYNCLPEETTEQGARRCLRFSSGFSNLGPGLFEVYGSSSTPIAPNGGPVYQVVHRSNGTSYSRPSGSFVFHEIHAHYHVLGIATFQIFRVLAPGKLIPAGTALKEGFCLGNVKIFDWYSFAQDQIDPNSSDNCEPSPQPDGSWRFYEGIAPGWEDVYVWQTSGQYVDFSGNPDGNYLLRLTVNPDRHILEADTGHDQNNVAYTYFRVTGNDVRTLERGRGASPWDPSKQVVDPVFGENR